LRLSNVPHFSVSFNALHEAPLQSFSLFFP
jgi:hypothetical protein